MNKSSEKARIDLKKIENFILELHNENKYLKSYIVSLREQNYILYNQNLNLNMQLSQISHLTNANGIVSRNAEKTSNLPTNHPQKSSTNHPQKSSTNHPKKSSTSSTSTSSSRDKGKNRQPYIYFFFPDKKKNDKHYRLKFVLDNNNKFMSDDEKLSPKINTISVNSHSQALEWGRGKKMTFQQFYNENKEEILEAKEADMVKNNINSSLYETDPCFKKE